VLNSPIIGDISLGTNISLRNIFIFHLEVSRYVLRGLIVWQGGAERESRMIEIELLNWMEWIVMGCVLTEIELSSIMLMCVGAIIAPGGGAPVGGGGTRRRRRSKAYDELVEYLTRYDKRSSGFRGKYPKSRIFEWSDLVPRKVQEIGRGPEPLYWLQKATLLLLVNEDAVADDQNSNENEVFEELAEFLKQWKSKSRSFRRNFPLSNIDQWSDHFPMKKTELEGCIDGAYWVLKLEQFLMDLNEEEE